MVPSCAHSSASRFSPISLFHTRHPHLCPHVPKQSAAQSVVCGPYGMPTYRVSYLLYHICAHCSHFLTITDNKIVFRASYKKAQFKITYINIWYFVVVRFRLFILFDALIIQTIKLIPTLSSTKDGIDTSAEHLTPDRESLIRPRQKSLVLVPERNLAVALNTIITYP